MSRASKRVHLASASPRRRDILESLGVRFTWGGVDVDEARLSGEAPAEMVIRLARSKASAAVPELDPASVVLGADTVVVLGDRLFGKPADRDSGVAMLRSLSGRTHEVLTGVAVVAGGKTSTVLSASEVTFRDIDPEEAGRYWQSGEPADKAGGYAIQGLGAIFVKRLAGSHSGVVGLPIYETAAELARAGVSILDPGFAA